MNQQSISGTVEKILYNNDETGFAVISVALNAQQKITATGHMPGTYAGQEVTLTGSWSMHPKFGRQFEITTCTSQLPRSLVGIKKYLGSGLIKGIGPAFAQKMVDHFGAAILEVIDKDPDRLSEISGIGPKKIERIKAAWIDQKEISALMVFLQDKGVSPTFAAKIYKRYGSQAIATLHENPYRLADDIWGIGFKTADTIAQKLGFGIHSAPRIKAGILHAIGTTTSNGHLYVELDELKKATSQLLSSNDNPQEQDTPASTPAASKPCDPALIKNALHDLYEAKKITLLTYQEKHFVTLPGFYGAEKKSAAKLLKLLETTSTHAFDLNAIYQTIRVKQHANDIELNEDQQRGILNCFMHKVTIITGGPGTGKTTLIKKLLSLMDSQNLIYRLAAPTGRAAKRMMEGTGRPAKTIHRLLEFNVATMGFNHNEQNALKLDVLIIDEASMLDAFLALSILKALPENARLILIGDVDQLPPVGPGNFLKDCLESGKIPSTRLTQIFRQAQDSLIVVNAHRINKGEWPTSSLPDAKRDFVFITEEKPEMIQQHITSIIKQRLPAARIHPDNCIVLAPMNRGIAGTIKLNQDIQQILNPGATQGQIMRASTLFKVGDRVMQIRNNYDKLVFNGDIGTITSIDHQESEVIVDYLGRQVVYEFQELDELLLAYAISIHKSQGSEYDAVIIPLFMQHFMLLARNLVYTALTRAKKLCIFIGQPKALAMALKNANTNKRITFLQQFLTSDLSCRT